MQTCFDIQVAYGDSCLKNQENAKLWMRLKSREDRSET